MIYIRIYFKFYFIHVLRSIAQTHITLYPLYQANHKKLNICLQRCYSQLSDNMCECLLSGVTLVMVVFTCRVCKLPRGLFDVFYWFVGGAFVAISLFVAETSFGLKILTIKPTAQTMYLLTFVPKTFKEFL